MKVVLTEGKAKELYKTWLDKVAAYCHSLKGKNSEWFWEIEEAYQMMPDGNKASFYKYLYKSRACLEVIRRIQLITQ